MVFYFHSALFYVKVRKTVATEPEKLFFISKKLYSAKPKMSIFEQ